MVALIRLRDAVFMPRRSSANDPERGAGPDGEGERPDWFNVGGR